jgi:hypothetical protein
VCVVCGEENRFATIDPNGRRGFLGASIDFNPGATIEGDGVE